MRYNRRRKQKIKKYTQYDKIISKRDKNLKSLTIHTTTNITDPEVLANNASIYERTELWTAGLKMWKLAADHYGDGRLYWIIGLYNSKPTDAHWSPGDTVYIPHPVELAMKVLEPR